MDRQQAANFMLDCLRKMMQKNGSDLFISAGFPPACKIHGRMTPMSTQTLSGEQTNILVRSIMNDRQVRDFDAQIVQPLFVNFRGGGHDAGVTG